MMNDYKDVRLVGLVGRAGSGKDTLADEIASDGWTKTAFAEPLKRMCIEYLGLSHDDAYTQDGKARMNQFWGMTNRAILQKVGTDAMRNGFHKDVWVKIAELRIRELLKSGTRVVVTDCRFDNECKMIEDLGGIVAEVVRDSSSSLSSDEQRHASEQPVNTGFIAFKVDNNRHVSKLKQTFYDCLREFSRRRQQVSDALWIGIENGMVDAACASRIVLDVKKFLSLNPDAAFASSGKFRMEWNGAKEYPHSHIEMSKDGIIVIGRHHSGDGSEFRKEFGYGDADGWKEACAFISEKCK